MTGRKKSIGVVRACAHMVALHRQGTVSPGRLLLPITYKGKQILKIL